MNHVVSFTIHVDDEEIKQRVLESGYCDIVENIEKACLKAMPNKKPSYGYRENPPKTWEDINWKNIIEGTICGFIERNKEEIIERSAELMVDKIKRTKVFRERVGELVDELELELKEQ